jgi:hypothetical protein
MYVIKCNRAGLTRSLYFQEYNKFSFIPSLAKWYKTSHDAARQVVSLYDFSNIEILPYKEARKFHKEAIENDD